MKVKKKHVLVTGGAGFIGSHIVDELVKRDCTVFVLDDLSNGTAQNLDWAKSHGDVIFENGSIGESSTVESIVRRSTCDVIFHLASGNLLRSLEDPRNDLSVTTGGVLNILEAIRKQSNKILLVFSSTGSVYGVPQYTPQDENHPLNPVSSYGISKLAAEKYVLLWHKLYKIPSVILRYYNVYGPRQNYAKKGGVIGIFIDRIMHNQSPIVEGDGKQERCFTYVSDVVRANILAAETSTCWGDVYNIAASEITTIEELACVLLKHFNHKLKPKYKPPRIGDIHEFHPSIQKAKDVFDYQPEVALAEGIKQTIAWFKTKENHL